MRFEFGGKSKLHGRIIFTYPARISYVPKSEEGLEEYIFAYKPDPLKIEHSTEEPVSNGDFLTPSPYTIEEAGGLLIGHIYPVVDSTLELGTTREEHEWRFVLDANAKGHAGLGHVVLGFQKLEFAIPGPLTEPNLYEGAEVSVDPDGEVVLHYKDLGVKVILETIAE